MKTLKILNNIPIKQQMVWGGGLAILVALAKTGFDTLVYRSLLPDSQATLREIGLSVREFYQKELVLNLVIALAGLFFLLAGLLAVEEGEKKE